MKIGLPLVGVGPRRAAEVARLAEDNGFESIWMPEHLVLPETMPDTYLYTAGGTPPIGASSPMYDPWVVLASIATATSTILLGTNVFILPLRHPISTARSVVTLDRLSGGRAVLGAGVGWLEPEYAALGQRFGDRGRRMDEIVPLLRRLWTDEIVTHHGEFFDFGPVRFEPKPVKGSIPIEIGGRSPAALRRAGRIADGWLEIGADTIEERARLIDTVRAEHARSDRADLPFEITCSCRADLDEIHRLEELGATRVLAKPAPGEIANRNDLEGWIKRWADEVIAHLI